MKPLSNNDFIKVQSNEMLEKSGKLIDQRERDILTLCDAVLSMSANGWDNPNGAYETTCPLCYAKEYRGGSPSGKIFAEMSEIEHKLNCAYLIAKDLSTNLI